MIKSILIACIALTVNLLSAKDTMVEEYYDEPDETSPDLQEKPEEIFQSGLRDLEAEAQDFVLEAKRIKIPGYPDPFNPSLLRWRGSLLLSFRIYDKVLRTTDKIGLVFLDEDFNALGRPQVIEFQNPDRHCLAKRQDPRLVQVGDRVYIVYNNVLSDRKDREIRRMVVAELLHDGSKFYVEKSDTILEYPGKKDDRSEKNWVPFDYFGWLLLSYSISPHRVLLPITGTDRCEEFAVSTPKIDWKWGVIRGGTPALRIRDEYLAFFHSSKSISTVHSKGKNIPHYFIGAYTFASHPPFAITKISPYPIIGKNFYRGREFKTWKPLKVVFPAGYVHDEEFIWLVFGKQDHEVWVAKIDRQKLFDSLIPVVSE